MLSTALRPLDPPQQGKCPIDDLPNELLLYVFQIGVEVEQEDSEHSEIQWRDVDGYLGVEIEQEDSEQSEIQWGDVDGDKVSFGIESSDPRVLQAATDSDSENIDALTPDFQILVSHVCRRWRAVVLNTPQFWTTLTFLWDSYPGSAETKEYISRSNGHPLTIEIHCDADDEKPDNFGDTYEGDLPLEEVEQVLDVLEQAISQWGKFTFYASSCPSRYIRLLMRRLDQFPAAPRLESFRIYRDKIWNNTAPLPAKYRKRYLPFNGEAPNLKEAVFWGVPVDWEGASSGFLQGLGDLEFAYLRKSARPTYAAFAEIINNCPGLRTLTLSAAGPLLADEAWGPLPPLVLPSLTKLVLQYLDEKYATALVRHLDMPNLTHLVITADQEDDLDFVDYSDFVQALTTNPVKGRDQSLLRQITHLEMTGLSFDYPDVEILLSELVSLKSLYFRPSGREDEMVCDALADPMEIYCPKLEEIAMALDEKELIIGRRDAGVPLKRIRNLY